MVAVDPLLALYYNVDFIMLFWNQRFHFGMIRGSLMRQKWLKLARLAQQQCTFYTFNSFVCSLLPNDKLLKNLLIYIH